MVVVRSLLGLVTGASAGACFASGMGADKPFPSLTQCYRHNEKACCKSAHDHLVKSALADLLAPACLKEYPMLEDLFCALCDSGSVWEADTPAGVFTGAHVRLQDNTVNLVFCESFLKSLWGDQDLNQPTTEFDNCGLLLDSESGGKRVVVPSAKNEAGEAEIPNVDKFLERISAIYPKLVLVNGAAANVRLLSEEMAKAEFTDWDSMECLSSSWMFSTTFAAFLAVLRW
mmetsp:Transcript_4610/g.10133  ORF Transcript_4610/g.10133 Transcript_4610/m.10133 type:complete len:230 (-) Transcript_4610:159-848(-)|eukprot:CAMPEP_0204270942 /NCGR_PEP_ID=MMETSP0468-20130131/19179_1 /ASSEMBLY_ACC=CAM_ASM_000383 /TAXON_ID=2969 /ORGANISM="Oxyrrhis marina" /LENGTH=229 /DNA_ID=CAMNT_0051246539 /DNA_START=44 /DNA_END=733 /DNA_ORIENTATION=+